MNRPRRRSQVAKIARRAKCMQPIEQVFAKSARKANCLQGLASESPAISPENGNPPVGKRSNFSFPNDRADAGPLSNSPFAKILQKIAKSAKTNSPFARFLQEQWCCEGVAGHECQALVDCAALVCKTIPKKMLDMMHVAFILNI